MRQPDGWIKASDDETPGWSDTLALAIEGRGVKMRFPKTLPPPPFAFVIPRSVFVGGVLALAVVGGYFGYRKWRESQLAGAPQRIEAMHKSCLAQADAAYSAAAFAPPPADPRLIPRSFEPDSKAKRMWEQARLNCRFDDDECKKDFRGIPCQAALAGVF